MRLFNPKVTVMAFAPPEPAISTQPDASLIGTLRAHGVRHLAVAEPAAPYAAFESTTLIVRLAGHPDPRLREALIPLFLRQPELADQAPGLVGRLPPPAADVLRQFYTAAVYLQRLWLSTLRIHLGSFPLLPDYFGQAHYRLPAPDEQFGEAGLRSLARLYMDKTGLDWLSVYESTMNLFLQQLSLEQSHHG
jgi:hypothetical protein